MLRLLRMIACVVLLLPAAARAMPIDLNLMFHDGGAPVSVAADGSTATLGEDPSIFAVVLSNVPGFGDPELITASLGAQLVFDYVFDMPAGNADLFHASLLNGTTGDSLAGFNFFRSDSAAGTVSFDLSSLIGATIGLQFELVPDFLDSAFSSTLTISNLRIDLPDATPVTEPQTLALLILGFALLLAGKFSRTSRG